jgi:hypothetical protein
VDVSTELRGGSGQWYLSIKPQDKERRANRKEPFQGIIEEVWVRREKVLKSG